MHTNIYCLIHHIIGDVGHVNRMFSGNCSTQPDIKLNKITAKRSTDLLPKYSPVPRVQCEYTHGPGVIFHQHLDVDWCQESEIIHTLLSSLRQKSRIGERSFTH